MEDRFFPHPLNECVTEEILSLRQHYPSNNESAQVGHRSSGVVQIGLQDSANPKSAPVPQTLIGIFDSGRGFRKDVTKSSR